jgi:lysophospholipase L1-like esterase
LNASQKQRLLIVAPAPLGDTSKGPFKDDFDQDAITESRELASAFRSESQHLGVPFFDAGSVIATKGMDGVHLDAAAHARLGRALTEQVKRLIRP